MAETLGQRIRALRHEQKLTLANLAARAAMSVSYLNDIEHDRTRPSLDLLVRISRALGLQVVEVMRGVPPYDEP